MRWFQALPDPLPQRRVHVQWNGLIEAVPVREGRYGVALLAMLDKSRGPAFGMLEWDVAVDNADLVAMEAFQASHGTVVCAPMTLYGPTTGASEPQEGHWQFGCIVFPTALLHAHRDVIAGLKYPTADADFFRLVSSPVMCEGAHPKHLHWV